MDGRAFTSPLPSNVLIWPHETVIYQWETVATANFHQSCAATIFLPWHPPPIEKAG